jgi:hypothetical protein
MHRTECIDYWQNASDRMHRLSTECLGQIEAIIDRMPRTECIDCWQNELITDRSITDNVSITDRITVLENCFDKDIFLCKNCRKSSGFLRVLARTCNFSNGLRGLNSSCPTWSMFEPLLWTGVITRHRQFAAGMRLFFICKKNTLFF